MNRSPDFFFEISIPVYIPTEEVMPQLPELQPHMRALVDAGHMTEVEAQAYNTFAALTSGIPFLMEQFLERFRKHAADNQLEEAPVEEEEKQAPTLGSGLWIPGQ